ncbi:hypothetical protein IQ269_17690 [Tychonema sp. LEGE 07199]|uniref:hypothetical protein n=1 Tax=unclassified Tychonema TaxID=2642144 RepID=UPI00188269D3|nr:MULTISPECIES: hypothetical protein [unclassified Tychonema]MBE9122581.1 hypothetical protein [Tychonema sp. LEGE 07199]MBE9133902.1 hypothetical protein [Tychonema sp. LEGE 07196]
MTPLTEKHAQLLKSNRALLLTFERLPIAGKLSAVALALLLGIYSGINAIQGTASNRVRLCIRNNKQALQCADKAGKPYIMTEYHAQQWKANGIPREVVFKDTIPATNPNKALWMALAAGSFGVAGMGLRSLQNSERQLANYEVIAEKRDLAKGQLAARAELLEDYRNVTIREVQVQGDLDATANDCAVVLKQCEVLGEADIKIAQLEAEEAIFDAETAGLSDEKKQEYIAFLRNQKTPFQLTGTQTLDGINNPSDKVESDSVSIIKSAKNPGEQLLDDLAYSDKSMILAGSTGAGKSHTLSAWLDSVYSQARSKGQTASVWILGRKNDSFCGLREAGKLTIFNSIDPTKAYKLIENFHKIFLARLENISEDDRKHLPPLRLILEDWSSIVLTLRKAYKALWAKIELMLLDIITVGRDYNVCLLVLAQSLNLEALGLVGDANLRANMAIVAQGLLVKTADGKTKGDYLLVELSIKNQYIVSDNAQRAMLLAQLNELMAESEAKQIPVFFTTLGNGNVGLLPRIEKAVIKLMPEERDEQLAFDIEKFRQYLIQCEAGIATAETSQKPQPFDSEYWERVYDLEFNLGDKKPSDSPTEDSPEDSPEEVSDYDNGQPEPLSDKLSGEVSGFVWTVRRFGQMFPNLAPEQLFVSVSDAALSGANIRHIIKSVLKCGEKNGHPTRSYSRHGKSLLKWLIQNYDDGEIAQLPKIQEFLQNERGNNNAQ